MDIFFNPWPKDLYCDSFPDANDTRICIGYKEAYEPVPPIGNLTYVIYSVCTRERGDRL